MQNQKLSLSEFSKKNTDKQNDQLRKITGGILGACHCNTEFDHYKNEDGSSVTYVDVVCYETLD